MSHFGGVARKEQLGASPHPSVKHTLTAMFVLPAVSHGAAFENPRSQQAGGPNLHLLPFAFDRKGCMYLRYWKEKEAIL